MHRAPIILIVFASLVWPARAASDPLAARTHAPAQVAAPVARFLAIADIHLDSSHTTTTWYSHDHSETSTTLWQAAQGQARKRIRDDAIEFVVYLGDMPGHNLTVDRRTGEFEAVLSGLRGIVTHNDPAKNIPLLYLPGNNDAVHVDYGSFTDIEHNVALTPFTYDQQHTSDWPVINGSVTAQSRVAASGWTHPPLYFGYYSSFPLGEKPKGLRVIMLNTVMFKRPGYYLKYDPTDGVDQQAAAQQQYEFLRSELEAASESANSQQVLIGMHMPAGLDGYGGNPIWDDSLRVNVASPTAPSTKPIKDAFLDLLDAHQDRIVGVLNGHTHLDGLRKFQGRCGKAVEMGISVPGITTDNGNNPAMKVFTYSTSDFELLEFRTHYATKSGGTIDWSQSYTFSDAYGGDGSSPMFDRIRTTPAKVLFDGSGKARGMNAILFANRDRTYAKTRWYEESINVEYGTKHQR